MKDMGGPGEIQARAAGFQGKDEERRTMFLLLEAVDHLVAQLGRGAAVQIQRPGSQGARQHFGQQVSHLRILGEYQGSLAGFHDLFQHFNQPYQFAAAAVGAGCRLGSLMQELSRVVADLF